MAKIKFQHPYESFKGRDSSRSGSYGNVAYTNGAVPISRTFVRPTQPGSLAQHYTRYAVIQGAIEWDALSSSDKASWEDLGSTITRVNSQGFSYNPQGRTLYIQAFITGWREGQQPPSTAPASWTPNATLPITTIQRGTAGGFTGINVTFIDTPVTGTIRLDFTKPLKSSQRSLAGKNFYFPGWLPIDAPGWGGSPPNFPPLLDYWLFYTNASGTNPRFFNDLFTTWNLSAGQRLGVRATPVDYATFIPGTPQYSIIEILP